ncbi:MAG: hypothetical protein PHG63_00220 [Candidatus Dojkabacteria bacterium]|nr:hypothetical protein [Candidatus Dojkabacteria bacterium]
MNRNALLRQIILSYPNAISERLIEREYTEIASLLHENGLLEQVESVHMIEGDDASLEEVIVHENKPFISYDGGGVEEIPVAELNAWRFNLRVFCSLLTTELLLDNSEDYRYADGLTFLGKRGDTHIYLSLCDTPNDIVRLHNSINKSHKAVIWLGDSQHIGTTPEAMICLSDFVSIEESGLIVDEGLFSKLLGNDGFGNAESLPLDKDILLAQKDGKSFELMLFKDGAVYKYTEKIRPQAARILQHLYTIRKYGRPHLKAQEMADKNLASSAKTITTRIAEVNRLCKKYKVREIFYCFPENKWGLNPELGCMQ